MTLSITLPSNWRRVKVESIVLQHKGAVRIGPFGSALKKHEYSESGIRVLGIEDVLPNRFESCKKKFIPHKKYEELLQYTVSPGDVLVTNMGTVGRACVFPDGEETSIISSHLIKMSLDRHVADSSYVCWALNNCSDVVRQIELKSHGAIMAGFNSSLLKQLVIPLPPLDEQRRIAAILEKADALRQQRRLALRRLGSLTHSIFFEMFGNPCTERRRFREEPLDGFLRFVTSGARGWAEFYETTGTRFIRSLDVQMNHIADTDPAFVVPPDNAEARRTRVKADDVLLTITGSRIGRVSPVPAELEGAFISQHVAILRLDTEQINPEFLSFFLSLDAGGQRQIARAQYGQTKPGLNFEQIRRFKIPVPPLDDQRKFVHRIHCANRIGKIMDQTAMSPDRLFASLEQRAFLGEL